MTWPSISLTELCHWAADLPNNPPRSSSNIMKKKVKQSDEPLSRLLVALIVLIALIWTALVSLVMYWTAQPTIN